MKGSKQKRQFCFCPVNKVFSYFNRMNGQLLLVMNHDKTASI